MKKLDTRVDLELDMRDGDRSWIQELNQELYIVAE